MLPRDGAPPTLVELSATAKARIGKPLIFRFDPCLAK
jgi:hypothetical protein